MAQSEGAVPCGSFPCSLATDIQAAWHTAKAGWLEGSMDWNQALGNAGWRWEVLPRPRILSSLTALTAKPANCEAQMLAMGCGCMETPGLSTDSYLQGWSGGNLWSEGSSDYPVAHWG